MVLNVLGVTQTHTHTHARTRAHTHPPTHPHTHTPTHPPTHPHTHPPTPTHTHPHTHTHTPTHPPTHTHPAAYSKHVLLQALGDDCTKVRDMLTKVEEWLWDMDEDTAADVYTAKLESTKKEILV